jgi:hypothetical protein
MNSISKIQTGKLLSDKDPNMGIYTGNTSGTTSSVPCLISTLNNGGEYLIVIDELVINYSDRTLVTKLIHYEKSLISGRWNVMENVNIDNTLFKNLDRLITNKDVILNTLNGTVTDILDASAYNISIVDNIVIVDGVEVINSVEVLTLKPEYMSYYTYINGSALGTGLVNMLVNDVKGKLNKKLI